MALALMVLATGWRFEDRVAVTGEINLAGTLYSVGGLLHKAAAAMEAGVQLLVLPPGDKAKLEAEALEAVGHGGELPEALLDFIASRVVEARDMVEVFQHAVQGRWAVVPISYPDHQTRPDLITPCRQQDSMPRPWLVRSAGASWAVRTGSRCEAAPGHTSPNAVSWRRGASATSWA
jgi:beta-glucosidase-like glycosyl hydrolase